MRREEDEEDVVDDDKGRSEGAVDVDGTAAAAADKEDALSPPPILCAVFVVEGVDDEVLACRARLRLRLLAPSSSCTWPKLTL